MAREAGLFVPLKGIPENGALMRFAALVRADERERIIAQNAPEIEKINAHIKALEEAVAAEREQCAKVCDDIGNTWALDCADAIRARGQA